MSIDELLETNNQYTKEENLLFDMGEETIIFDTEQELLKGKEQLNNYIVSKEYILKAILQTINERIFVILH